MTSDDNNSRFLFVYHSEIISLVNEIDFGLAKFFDWKDKQLKKPNLYVSNMDMHNSRIQDLVVKSARLASILQGTSTKNNKQKIKQRKKFLSQIGINYNSQLNTLLNKGLRDTITHFDEKIDCLNFGSDVAISNLVVLYNLTIGDVFQEYCFSDDKRFNLYKCQRFRINNSENQCLAPILPLKVYCYKDDNYYNLNSKLNLKELLKDVRFLKENLNS